MFVDILGKAKLKIGINISCSDDRESIESTASRYAREGYDALCMPLVYKYMPESEISGLLILSSCAYTFGEDREDGKKISVIGIGMTSDPCVPEDWRHMVKTEAQKAGEAVRMIKHLGGVALVILQKDHTLEIEELERLSGADLIEAHSMSNEVFFALSSTECFPSVVMIDADEVKSYLCVDAHDFSSQGIMLALHAGRFFSSEGPELHMCMANVDKAVINCSPSKRIAYYTSSTSPAVDVVEGDNYIADEYIINEDDTFIMASVFDEHGNRAFSSTTVTSRAVKDDI